MNTEEVRKKIGQISDGTPIKLGNMTIQATENGMLLVTGWTNTIYFENITKASVLQELEELKLSFYSLFKLFGELKEIIKKHNFTIQYHIQYDDAGKVGIVLCSELDGKINWYIPV